MLKLNEKAMCVCFISARHCHFTFHTLFAVYFLLVFIHIISPFLTNFNIPISIALFSFPPFFCFVWVKRDLNGNGTIPNEERIKQKTIQNMYRFIFGCECCTKGWRENAISVRKHMKISLHLI